MFFVWIRNSNKCLVRINFPLRRLFYFQHLILRSEIYAVEQVTCENREKNERTRLFFFCHGKKCKCLLPESFHRLPRRRKNNGNLETADARLNANVCDDTVNIVYAQCAVVPTPRRPLYSCQLVYYSNLLKRELLNYD